MVRKKPELKLTVEDYMATSDDERWELLDGELIRLHTPGTLHQMILVKLGCRMSEFIDSRGLGKVFAAPTDVVLSNTDVVEPDLLFVFTERQDIITHANIQGAPDLIVEILSSGTAERDQGYKRELYARYGVKEYWIVGTDPDAVSVLLLQDNGYEVVETLGAGETLKSPTLSGLSIDVDDIFAP